MVASTITPTQLMTTFKYTYTVHGRPKNPAVDKFMEDLNKNYHELSGDESKVQLSGVLGEFSFQIPDSKEAESKIPTILMKATEVFEGKFSDVSIKLKSKEAV